MKETLKIILNNEDFIMGLLAFIIYIILEKFKQYYNLNYEEDGLGTVVISSCQVFLFIMIIFLAVRVYAAL